MPRPSVPKVPLICKECSIVFYVAHTRKDTALFCSTPCHDTWRSSQATAEFWDKMERCGHDGDLPCPYCCWPWKAATGNKYGGVYVRNKRVGAHRRAWELFQQRTFPEGLDAAHWCHYKACGNPAHIRPATPQENSDDSVRDHRMLSGEDHPNSRLTEETAIEAIRLKVDGWSNVEIARHLHVSKSTIRNLMAGDIWKDIPRPAVIPKVKPGPRPQQPI